MSVVDTLLSHYADIMPAVDDFVSVSKVPLPVCAWVNTARVSVETLRHLLAEDGIESTLLPYPDNAIQITGNHVALGKHWTYRCGLLQIQEAASMWAGAILQPKPGERVLDLCAAPGNKAGQMALSMRNRGTLVANDLRVNRLRAWGQISQRLGLLNVSTTSIDGTRFPVGECFFDKILVDAPCSCMGTYRRKNNDFTWVSDKQRTRLSHIQCALLKRAVALCRPGGKILYSTCTFSPEENEAVIDYLLRAYPDTLRVRRIDLPGIESSAGLLSWQGRRYHADCAKTTRIWPHQQNSGGFYMALLEKIPDPAALALDVQSVVFEDQADSLYCASHLRHLVSRYGLPDHDLNAMRYRATKKGFYAVNADHALPVNLRTDLSGLFWVKTRMRFPKPTTAAVWVWGANATRQVVSLSRAQLALYLQGADCILESIQCRRCDGTGYVVLHYAGISIGLGILFAREDERPVLRSLFPKHLQ